MIIDAKRLTGDLQPYLEGMIGTLEELEIERYYDKHGEEYRGTLVHRSMEDMMAEVARDMPRFLEFIAPTVFGDAAPVKVLLATYEGYAYPVELSVDWLELEDLARHELGEDYDQADPITVIEDLIDNEDLLMHEEFSSWFYLLGNAVYAYEEEA